ncbi:MAG: hypothetical protein RX318_10940 [bacterium]|nr:hypothetical protein [bacterium]
MFEESGSSGLPATFHLMGVPMPSIIIGRSYINIIKKLFQVGKVSVKNVLLFFEEIEAIRNVMQGQSA